MKGKSKGEAGKIGVIGGSVEYTGAPYFSAISALKVGADLVYIITTTDAAPIIKTYSPELIVYPFLNEVSAHKIPNLLNKMDVLVIGPGLGREDSTKKMITDILNMCRTIAKPIIIDADGLYIVSKNLSLIRNYPSPGVVLTPNIKEKHHLNKALVKDDNEDLDLGSHVYVLNKGEKDEYHTELSKFRWILNEGGSSRRAGGQGDILSGALGTFFNWALKSKFCGNETDPAVAASVASFAAAKFTRMCNEKAFQVLGRSMTASDMLNQIHFAFEELFENANN
ncbi:ATP-dependent [Eumeta japonica]|uniref:ATP-dependent (S)-NAD(P)H-hydrate dehydratase n=1 Tax=Eumeta variegata TaxID=151549 RepID=A0A4C1WZD2_EUMVA|nr:ATP-dependent [Eumeta japonica]